MVSGWSRPQGKTLIDTLTVYYTKTQCANSAQFFRCGTTQCSGMEQGGEGSVVSYIFDGVIAVS